MTDLYIAEALPWFKFLVIFNLRTFAYCSRKVSYSSEAWLAKQSIQFIQKLERSLWQRFGVEYATSDNYSDYNGCCLRRSTFHKWGRAAIRCSASHVRNSVLRAVFRREKFAIRRGFSVWLVEYVVVVERREGNLRLIPFYSKAIETKKMNRWVMISLDVMDSIIWHQIASIFCC